MLLSRSALPASLCVLVLSLVSLSGWMSVVSAASVAGPWTNFTLFSDSACKSPLGDPAELPYQSSPKCQVPQGEPGASFVLLCSSSTNLTALQLSVWNATSDCSGEPTISVASNATSHSCAPANITYSSTTIPAYIQVACSASAAQHTPTHPTVLGELVDSYTQLVQGEVARQRRLQRTNELSQRQRQSGGRGRGGRAGVNRIRQLLEGAGQA